MDNDDIIQLIIDLFIMFIFGFFIGMLFHEVYYK